MRLSESVRAFRPDQVLFREIDGEAVVLDLDTEIYFGLNEVGARIWQLVTEEANLNAAFQALGEEYEVEPDVLRQDMETLLDQLVERGLLVIRDV